MFRAAKAALATTALIIAGIGVASPAHAAASVTISSSYVASPSSVSDTSVTFTNTASGDVNIGSPFSTGGATCVTTGTPNCVVLAGRTATFDIRPGIFNFWTIATNSAGPIGDTDGTGGTLKLLVTYDSSGGGGGGGGGGSSSSAAAAPQTVEISLIPEDGTTCRNSSQPGTAGTWISLPGADACTPPASKAGATLLGWATSPNFPVAIAKRQVDNGWGAYETFNDDGQLTGVFIPAGGATFLSGSGKLYTIWSE